MSGAVSSAPLEAPQSLDPRPPAPDSVRAAAQTFERMITEKPAESAASPAPSPPPAPAATPSAAPAADLTTAEGRILAGVAAGVVSYSPQDVEECRDRLRPEEFHALKAEAIAQQTRLATVTTFHQQQRARFEERVPEARDPSALRQLTDELTAYAAQFDFTEQDVHAVADSRTIELARDGLRARQKVRELERQLAAERAGGSGAEARPTPRTRRTTVELPARMGIHDAARLLEQGDL
jgi:hypothetical protein